MLGIGVAERSGLIAACLKGMVQVTPAGLLTPAVIFVGINSSLATDAGYVVLPPLAAAVFAKAGRAPLVVTAHGRDVRNVGWIPGIGAATRLVVRRAAAVIAVSDYLRRELEAKVPDARGKTEVVDSGVDVERFAVQAAPAGASRAHQSRYWSSGGSVARPAWFRTAEVRVLGHSTRAARL